MTSGHINPLILAHPEAVVAWRALMGPTKSCVAKATDAQSIRGLFSLSDTRNCVHGAGKDSFLIAFYIHVFVELQIRSKVLLEK